MRRRRRSDHQRGVERDEIARKRADLQCAQIAAAVPPVVALFVDLETIVGAEC